RNYFTSHSELRVWIQTQDQDGTVFNSKTVSFNTMFISSQHRSSFYGKSLCISPFQQKEGGVSGSYTLNNPEPCTNYSFQVRCACGTSMMSGWSKVHVIRSAERAPIGKLDIWRDCDMLRPSSNCVLTWKRLPMSQARGHILGYNLTLYYNNGTNSVLNMSAAESVCMICNEVQCYHNSSLKDVKFVSFNAYNALGMTAPSHLAVQTPGIHIKAIDLKMNRNNLSVSWNATWISDNISEFVVQYKEAGSPLGKGLDWVRVNTRQFKNYTAYQVSVFTISYTLSKEVLPAKVPLFKVLTYGTTHVTLLWETVLMSVHNVYNVSAYPQMENRTFTLTNLTEDHNYKVWIKAVNQAGSGPNTTVLFKTQDTENIGMKELNYTFSNIIFFVVKNKTCPIAFLDKKIPDPHNMLCFVSFIDNPATEQHPKMSIIEIVNISQRAFTSKMADQMNCDIGDNIVEEGRQKTQCGSGKEEYSKMIDSDEDKNEEEEDNDTCSSSSGGDHAGYEQHFMPTELDIKAVEERERTERSWDEMM
uniref:Fibronectin type-III domain-containing protein n=1 Tax=Periophthalmus magnuspinnatus TaxID=409849 RepID=A0A3B4BF09_9GOBI